MFTCSTELVGLDVRSSVPRSFLLDCVHRITTAFLTGACLILDQFVMKNKCFQSEMKDGSKEDNNFTHW